MKAARQLTSWEEGASEHDEKMAQDPEPKCQKFNTEETLKKE